MSGRSRYNGVVQWEKEERHDRAVRECLPARRRVAHAYAVPRVSGRYRGREGSELVRVAPYYGDSAAYRAQLEAKGLFDDPMFDIGKDFAEADEIVIGAPYWDLSFPAALKIYIEHAAVMGMTFHYTEEGRCEGLCRAKHLTYITTGGGQVSAMNYGYEYLCGIASMFGIPETRFAAAENLDVVGADIEANLNEARKVLSRLKATR